MQVERMSRTTQTQLATKGETMSTITTAADTVRNAFSFDVDKYPLSGPDNMRTPFYGLFRSDTGESVGTGSVGEGYHGHTTDDVVAIVEATEHAFDSRCRVRCHFNHAHFVTVQPSDDYRREIANTGGIFPRMLIKAGYDRTAFSVTVGTYRDRCSNLMMLESVNETAVRIHHTKSLRTKIDELVADLQTLKGGWDNLVARIEQFQAREVEIAEFVRECFPVDEADSKRTQTIREKRVEAIVSRLYREQRQAGKENNKRATLWECFNAVQGHQQHDATRQNNPGAFDRMLMAQRDKHVHQAERVAVAMLSA